MVTPRTSSRSGRRRASFACPSRASLPSSLTLSLSLSTLEQSSGRFPANLIYNSLTPPPNPGFSFPLLSPSHACFLIGFYNQNARPPTTQQNGAPSPAAVPGSTANKRVAPPDPAAAASKRAKPNPSGSAASPQLANANLAATRQQPTPPTNPSRTPNQPQPSPRLVPNRSPSMPIAVPTTLTNETLQQYIADMQAAAARSGHPPPTAADIQAAALAAYAKANGGRPPGSTGPQHAALPQQQQQHPQQQQQQQMGTPRQMTQQQLNGLPQIPPDMKAKIEAHLEGIRKKVERGEMSQEQAGGQVKKLQEMANQCVLPASLLSPLSPLDTCAPQGSTDDVVNVTLRARAGTASSSRSSSKPPSGSTARVGQGRDRDRDSTARTARVSGSTSRSRRGCRRPSRCRRSSSRLRSRLSSSARSLNGRGQCGEDPSRGPSPRCRARRPSTPCSVRPCPCSRARSATCAFRSPLILSSPPRPPVTDGRTGPRRPAPTSSSLPRGASRRSCRSRWRRCRSSPTSTRCPP